MKFILTGLLLLFCAGNALAQSGKPLYKHKELAYAYQDDATCRTYFSEDLPDFAFVQNGREQEYFVPEDTSRRDYFQLSGRQYTLDSLFLKSYSDYAGCWELTDMYLIKKQEYTFLVICCGNIFQMGTDSQPLFIILKKNNNGFDLQSTYYISNVEDNSLKHFHSIRYECKNGMLTLSGDNLLIIN